MIFKTPFWEFFSIFEPLANAPGERSFDFCIGCTILFAKLYAIFHIELFP